jgi:hypothetical protein
MNTRCLPFIDRRHFLRGLGMALALPAFESLHAGFAAAAPKANPRRLICIGNHLGFWPDGFFPKAQGADYEISQTLAPLTSITQLDADGDLPGAAGVACFEWSARDDFSDAQRTPFQAAIDKQDFIVRAELNSLNPNTTYHYRACYGATEATAQAGPSCAFRTLPGAAIDSPVRFIVGSCMNYNKFMHGKRGKASGPETATETDKRLGQR